MSSGTNEFSVMQFNCLADALSDAFPHVSKDILSWSHRMKLFEKLFASPTHDFLCLEEVDHFDDFFKPFLSKLGYSGRFYQRRSGPSPISRDGVALFWRNDRFVLCSEDAVKSEKKTFGIVGLFDDTLTSKKVCVSVVHLTAKPGFEEERLQEVKLLEAKLLEVYDVSAMIVGGDFNDTPDSIACDHMRSLHFVSVYSHTPDSWTTWKKRSSVVKRVIDYIWYLDLMCEVTSILEHSDDSFPSMLPDFHHPSDHINLAATFQIN
jgi:nocturnin